MGLDVPNPFAEELKYSIHNYFVFPSLAQNKCISKLYVIQAQSIFQIFPS